MSSRGYPVTQGQALSLTSRIREERHTQALKRLETYSKLTVQEKLSRLPENGAKKQRDKLLKMLTS